MMNRVKIMISLSILAFIASSLFVQIAVAQPLGYSETNVDQNSDKYSELTELLQKTQSQEFPPAPEVDSSLLHENATYPEDFDMSSFLSNNVNEYDDEWDPWLTKAAIHDIVTKDDGDMIALAGGYLYDNEIHVYRWNYIEDKYDKVWDVGDGIFQSDVTSLAFSDVDYNNLTELVAGCADGRLYVFEQRHLYDPVTNLENQFDLVWTSPRLGRIWDVIVSDTDKDYKPDIIVGTGDTIRFYEYYHHSGYPFSTEHWIDFEEVFSYTVDSPITALTTSDIDYDGLPEVVIGTNSGEVILLENEGTSLLINNVPYPITNDNHYYEMWSSGDLIRRSITSMSGGNLDDDGVKEILIAAQGQGAYILDSVEQGDDYFPQLMRLNREYESWEDDDVESYPLDYYIDYMINSSSYLYGNVLYNNVTDPYIHTEPLNQTFGNVFIEVYPYNTAMAQNATGGTIGQAYNQFTLFNGTVNQAWAIVDFNYDEEATGNGMFGVTGAYDLIVNLGPGVPPSKNDFTFELSTDGEHFYQVPSDDITVYNNIFSLDDYLNIEVDPTLIAMSSDYYRYIRVNVTNDEMFIDYMQTRYIHKPLYDALSTEVGSTIFKGDTTATPVAFVGTVGGSILGIVWDDSENRYKVTWDSWVNERWKLNKNIFDLAFIKQSSRFPAWIDRGTMDYGINLQSGMPMTGVEVIDFDAANFLFYEYENNLEFFVSGESGQMSVYTQMSPTAPPTYDAALTNALFSYPDAFGLNNYISTTNPHEYWSVNLVPMVTGEQENDGLSSYWVFLGHWDGTLGQLDLNDQAAVGEVDIVAYYFYQDKLAYPIMSNWPEIPEPTTLSNSELTGQMWGIFRESTWMPKTDGGDFTGSSDKDLVVTNGKIHLLETKEVADPYAKDGIPYGKLETILVDNYFKEINENSKGRHWTNPNVVDFDGDGDNDLILGFATYDEATFGIDKKGFGMTYWENQGSREKPKWVERKKAVTNNDPDSNFRVNLYRSPVMVCDEYDWGNNPNVIHDYSPEYLTGQPTRLFMFEPNNHVGTEGWKIIDDYYAGKIKQFKASYEHPSSLLVATYPEAKRLDINLQYSPYPIGYNYGFHIVETWSNVEELAQWTLAMTASDLDEDGMNEIIVGDFDNNIYVFEHMTNNTYKRAFRSFDINRSEITTLSPYAWEQFEGISGEFTRKIFQHVKHLVAGSDLDQDGLQEFIAATDDMIFIFEATYSPTGRIVDDTYILVDMIDIREIPQLDAVPVEERVINAITYADDLTADGRQEIIIAVTSALVVYEIDPEGASGAATGSFQGWNKEEVFTGIYYGTDYFEGKYGVPGNAYKFPDFSIQDLLITDLDRDGRLEIVYGGYSGSNTARPLRDGFVNILEWNDGDFFYYGGEAFREITQYQLSTIDFTEVYKLETADQDYDGLQELIIGHEHGIDIYECTGHFEFERRESITSNPNYPVLKPKYTAPYPSADVGVTHSVAAYVPYGESLDGNTFAGDKALVEMLNGTLVLFYKHGKAFRYAISNDEGVDWQYKNNLYNLIGVSYIDIFAENEIDAIINRDPSDVGYGDIWVAYTLQYDAGSAGSDPRTTIVVLRYDASADSWDPHQFVRTTLGYIGNGKLSPALFDENYDLGGIVISMAYIDFPFNTLKFGYVQYDLPTFYTNPNCYHDFANNSLLPTQINATGIDIVELDTEDGDDFGIVVSGFLQGEVLSMDHDLFFGQFKSSSTAFYQFNFSRFTRVTTSGMSSYNPTMIREWDTNNIVIAYEEMTLKPYGGLWAVWSNDNGMTWSEPYSMNYPVGIYDPTEILFSPASVEGSNAFYLESPMFNGIVSYYKADGPALASRSSKGFHMVYTLDFEVQFDFGRVFVDLTASYLTTVTNPHSNFMWYDVGGVTDIAVGDSDADGREEIFAASGNNAMVFEYSENSAAHILHDQVWISPDYEHDVAAVLIADGNGNGYPELLIESQRGIVHSYEVVAHGGITDIIFPVLESTINTTLDVENTVTRILILDVTGDDTDDLIYCTSRNQLVVIDGSDFSVFLDVGTQVVSEDFDGDIEIIRDDAGKPVAIAMINDCNLTIWDLATGELADQFDFESNDIRSLTIAETTGNGREEIVIGTNNGTMYVLKLNAGLEQSIQWQQNYTTGAIAFVSRANISLSEYDDIVSIDGNGNVTAYSYNGTFLWNNISSYSFWGSAVFDINGDGIDDVVSGTNRTFAFDGRDGTPLWNATAPTWMMSPPVLEDINDDGVLDLLFGTSMNPIAGWPEFSAGAINGRTGEILWTYDSTHLGISGGLCPHLDAVIGDLDLSTILEVLVVSTNDIYFGFPEKLVYILDPVSGAAHGTIPLDVSSMAVEIADFGSDRNVILVGAEDGTVKIYSVYHDQPEPVKPETNFVEPSSLFQVYGLYHDDMLAVDTDADGVDEILVVQDEEVVAHGINGSELWNVNTGSYGLYEGPAKIADFGNGPTLIVAYNSTLVFIDVSDGKVVAEHKWQIDKLYVDGRFDVSDVTGDNVPDIVFARDITKTGIINGRLGILDGKDLVIDKNNGNPLYFDYPEQNNVKYAIGDYDGDGDAYEVVAIFQNYTHPLGNYRFMIYEIDTGTDLINEDLPYFMPVRFVAAGNFDNDYAGDEFVLYVDFAWMNTIVGFDVTGFFPDIMIPFAYDGTNLKIGGNVFVAPVSGKTAEAMIFDIDGNGYSDMLVRTERNRYYAVNGTDMSITSTIPLAAMADSDTATAIGNFDGSGQTSIAVVAHDKLLMMTNIIEAPAVEWYSQLTDDMILDVTVGDFDGDDIDDIAAMSYWGRVYIYSSEKAEKLSLDAVAGEEQLIDGTLHNGLFDNLPVTQVLVALPVLISGSLVMLRRRRINGQ